MSACEECGKYGTDENPVRWRRVGSSDYFLTHANCTDDDTDECCASGVCDYHNAINSAVTP